jgi:NH3-dependent NAD+ synthetase
LIFTTSQDIIEFNDQNIPLHIKKIGIKLSGGADSAIVCYMLAKYIKECRPDITLYPITAVSSTKPYNAIFAQRIIEKIQSLLNFEFGQHWVRPVESSTSQEYMAGQEKFINELYQNQIIHMHFSGITAIPDSTDAPELHNTTLGGPVDNRSKGTHKKPQHGASWRKPLINVDKKAVFDLYQNLGVVEELFPLTRSCEARTTDFSRHCEQCWFCKERFWAFQRYT